MNSPPDDFDAALSERFRQEHTRLPTDPFVAVTARRIAAARRRADFMRRALQVAGLAAVIFGSRWLIEASALASTRLNAWFAVGVDWLVTPLGTIAVLLVVIGAAAASRWRSRIIGFCFGAFTQRLR